MAKDRIVKPFLYIAKDQHRIDNIENMKGINFAFGDVVDLLGYYEAGDGAHHKRVISDADDGSGVQLTNGLWANIVHNGEVNVSWFGAKGDGVTDDTVSFQKALNISNAFIPAGVFVINSCLDQVNSIRGLDRTKTKISSNSLDYVIRRNRLNDAGYYVETSNISIEINNDATHCFTYRKDNTANLCHLVFEKLQIKGGNGVFANPGVYIQECIFRDIEVKQVHKIFCKTDDYDAPVGYEGQNGNVNKIENFFLDWGFIGAPDCLFDLENYSMFQIDNMVLQGKTYDTTSFVTYMFKLKDECYINNLWVEFSSGVEKIRIADIYDESKLRIKNINCINLSNNNGLFRLNGDGCFLELDNINVNNIRNEHFVFFGSATGKTQQVKIKNSSSGTLRNEFYSDKYNLESMVYKPQNVNFSCYDYSNKAGAIIFKWSGCQIVRNDLGKVSNELYSVGASIDNSIILDGSSYVLSIKQSTGNIVLNTKLQSNKKYTLHIRSKSSSGDAVLSVKNSNVQGNSSATLTKEYANSNLMITNVTGKVELNVLLNSSTSIEIESLCITEDFSLANVITKPLFNTIFELKDKSSVFPDSTVFVDPSVPCISFYKNGSYRKFDGVSNVALLIDTPYYTLKMQQEGVYEDYVAYRDELHEYEQSQQQNEGAMLMNEITEPVIPETVKTFAEKYNLI